MTKYMLDVLSSKIIDDKSLVRIHIYKKEDVEKIPFRPKDVEIDAEILSLLIGHEIDTDVVTVFEVNVSTRDVSLEKSIEIAKLLEDDEYDDDDFDLEGDYFDEE